LFAGRGLLHRARQRALLRGLMGFSRLRR
jgi:hypothetical protein